MARTCTICAHPQREEIDQALVAGREALRDIARRFATSKDAVARHRAEHLPAVIAQARQQRDQAHVAAVGDEIA